MSALLRLFAVCLSVTLWLGMVPAMNAQAEETPSPSPTVLPTETPSPTEVPTPTTTPTVPVETETPSPSPSVEPTTASPSPMPTKDVDTEHSIYIAARRAATQSLPDPMPLADAATYNAEAWSLAEQSGDPYSYRLYYAGWASGVDYTASTVESYNRIAALYEGPDSDLYDAAQKAIGYRKKAAYWSTTVRSLALTNAQVAANRVFAVYATAVPRADGVDVTPKREGVTVVEGSNGLVDDPASPLNGKPTVSILVDGYTFTYVSGADVFVQYIPTSTSLTDATVSVSDQSWTGRQVTPSVTVLLGGVPLVGGVDYTIKYGTNKAIGRGTVTLTGAGTFTGVKAVSFKIVPKSTRVTKTKALKRALKVYVTKASKAQKVTKAQVQYRVVGSSTWKTKTFSAKATSVKLKRLKKGQVLEVRSGVYKVVSGTRYYASWSPIKTSKRVK